MSTEQVRPLRGWQRRAMVKYLAGSAARFLGRRHPRVGEDDVRPAGGRRTARSARRRADHRRRAHRAPQGAVGAGRGGLRVGPGPEVLQHQTPDLAGVSRRDGHLRPGRSAPDAAPGAHRAAQNPGRLRRDPPRRRRQDLGRRDPGSVRRRHPPTCVDGHTVSQRRQPDPVRHLHVRPRRNRAFGGRSQLRLCRSARRRRGPAGGVPRLFRGGALARQRRRRARGTTGRAAVRRADRAGLADGAGPGRSMDARGDRGRRPTAAPAAHARARRRRHDHRLRSDRRARLREAADHDHLGSAHAGAVRRPRIVNAHKPIRREHQPLAGRGAHGVRGCRRAPAVGRDLRHERLDAAVLRAGRRAVRAVSPAG